MKSKLPFKATFRLALKGKWLTRIVTIVLCSFCFALVALSSTKFAYDRTAYAAEEVLFAAQHVDGLTVFDYESYFEHDLYGDGKGEALTQYNIDLITEGTGLDFLYYYQGGNDYSIYSGVAGVPLFYSVYGMEGKEYRDIQDAVCGPYPLLEELGYTMAAGRYPENIREIAVTEAQFETFRELGFSDNEGLMDRVEYGRHELCRTERPAKGICSRTGAWPRMCPRGMRMTDIFSITGIGTAGAGQAIPSGPRRRRRRSEHMTTFWAKRSSCGAIPRRGSWISPPFTKPRSWAS